MINPSVRTLLTLSLFATVALTGCRSLDTLQTSPCVDEVEPDTAISCTVPGYSRAYDFVVPANYNAETPTALVIALHGGGGNRGAALRTTCPYGDIEDPDCLHTMATERGFAVVAPDGTESFLDARSWNAGGGGGEFRCVGGEACEDGVDDVAFINALLDDVGRKMNLDETRVYVTGLSNGGAMAHRLACELSDRVTAIAPIGGAMQFTTNARCEPTMPVPILAVHGSDDPCWPMAGGTPNCPVGDRDLKFVSVSRTMREWGGLKRCENVPLEDQLPDTSNDGTTTVRQTWQGCDSELTLLRIDGGGHTWPGGYQYLGPRVVGPVATDWGNEVILNFFQRHRSHH